jgi:hypothetical protein
LNIADFHLCCDIETLFVTLNYGGCMALANHFSRDRIGGRLRVRTEPKGFQMSFFKKLFGGGGEAAAPKAARSAEHKGFTIEARPYKEGGQFQLAGVISKEIDGVRKEHKYVRADRFTSLEEAAEIALVKGRQIIDEQGERLLG